jgi:hypothetical protein
MSSYAIKPLIWEDDGTTPSNGAYSRISMAAARIFWNDLECLNLVSAKDQIDYAESCPLSFYPGVDSICIYGRKAGQSWRFLAAPQIRILLDDTTTTASVNQTFRPILTFATAQDYADFFLQIQHGKTVHAWVPQFCPDTEDLVTVLQNGSTYHMIAQTGVNPQETSEIRVMPTGEIDFHSLHVSLLPQDNPPMSPITEKMALDSTTCAMLVELADAFEKTVGKFFWDDPINTIQGTVEKLDFYQQPVSLFCLYGPNPDQVYPLVRLPADSFYKIDGVETIRALNEEALLRLTPELAPAYLRFYLTHGIGQDLPDDRLIQTLENMLPFYDGPAQRKILENYIPSVVPAALRSEVAWNVTLLTMDWETLSFQPKTFQVSQHGLVQDLNDPAPTRAAGASGFGRGTVHAPCVLG